jgi:ABC-2 type transport system permease protein
MRRIWVLARNDLLQVIKDRPSVFWMLLLPMAFIYLFSSFNNGGGAAQIALAVIDEDRSLLSGALAQGLARESFVVTELEPAAAETLGVRRSLRIPCGFQDSLAAGHPGPVYYYVSEDADASASLVAEMNVRRAVIQTLVNLTRAVVSDTASTARAAGAGPAVAGLAGMIGAGAGGARDTLRIDAAFGERLARIAAEPRVITVRGETAGRGRPVPSGARQSLPATVTLFMLVNTTIFGAVFLATERQEGMLARIAAHPVSRVSIFAGKLLGALLLALLQAGILLCAGQLLMGVYPASSGFALALVVFCFALVAASMALFWGAILRKPEQVTATALVAALFLGAIGGCWWPLEIVPGWMRTAGHISPAAWAMDAFHAIISYGAGWQGAVLPCLVLLGYAALFIALGARLLKVTG